MKLAASLPLWRLMASTTSCMRGGVGAFFVGEVPHDLAMLAGGRARCLSTRSTVRKRHEKGDSMLHLDIPGHEPLELEHLVCDFNGTLADDGYLQDGVVGRFVQISTVLQIHLLTADTYGTSERAAREIQEACVAANVSGPHWERAERGHDKDQYVQRLGPQRVVAIGNGGNDVAMFRAAALSMCVIGHEGACTQALLASDLVVTSPFDALDALLQPKRLVATLRR
jgi:soluble P-type ATPase